VPILSSFNDLKDDVTWNSICRVISLEKRWRKQNDRKVS
jgi:hypothetical protein